MQSKIWVQLEESPDAGIVVRWRLSGSTDDKLQSADFAQFKSWLSALQSNSREVFHAVLLLSGEQVVSRMIAFAANEKKHLAKLLPFMLESQLAVDLSQVHVAHVLSDDAQAETDSLSAVAAYTDKKQLQWRIASLESLGLEVGQVFSIPAIMPATQTSWSLLPDGDICHLNAGNISSVSLEQELLPALMDIVVADLAPHGSAPTLTLTLTVFVVDDRDPERARTLLQTLSEHEGIKEAGIKISSQRLPHAWSNLDSNQKQAVNLRQGEFVAPLRLAKYWKQWRVPAIAAMVAMSAVLVTAIVEAQINQYRFRALEARIEQRYREVMPEGVLVDAVQQLSAQVSQRRNAGSTQSLISMLGALLEPFENTENLNLHRLGYSSGNQAGGASTEIQLSVGAPGAAEILQLSESLNAAGWSAQAQNISRVGDAQQANLLIRGSAQ